MVKLLASAELGGNSYTQLSDFLNRTSIGSKYISCSYGMNITS